MTELAHADSGLVYCFVGKCDFKLWGMTPSERTRKLLEKTGAVREVSLDEARAHAGSVLVVQADAVFDGPLVPALLGRDNFILLSSDAGQCDMVVANVAARDLDEVLLLAKSDTISNQQRFAMQRPEDLQVSFKRSLVKRETPFALRLREGATDKVEWDMFMSTYKGATDLVTKHVWPVPAFHVTRFLAARGVSPNTVTAVGAAAMLIAFGLFLYGHYWPGLVFAWLMTFLDTVDGKLARTTLTSSFWGDIFDHGIDLVHPPFWYMAWIFGLSTWGNSWPREKIIWILAIIFGGYILQRLIEGIAIKWLKLVIHIWRPIDTLFRKITARRNPNLVILTACMLVQRPDWGIVAVAAWTVVCLILHGIQLSQALVEVSRSKGPLKSWMDRL
jgi:phosphatidylglycerophosphate synthase